MTSMQGAREYTTICLLLLLSIYNWLPTLTRLFTMQASIYCYLLHAGGGRSLYHYAADWLNAMLSWYIRITTGELQLSSYCATFMYVSVTLGSSSSENELTLLHSYCLRHIIIKTSRCFVALSLKYCALLYIRPTCQPCTKCRPSAYIRAYCMLIIHWPVGYRLYLSWRACYYNSHYLLCSHMSTVFKGDNAQCVCVYRASHHEPSSPGSPALMLI